MGGANPGRAGRDFVTGRTVTGPSRATAAAPSIRRRLGRSPDRCAGSWAALGIGIEVRKLSRPQPTSLDTGIEVGAKNPNRVSGGVELSFQDQPVQRRDRNLEVASSGSRVEPLVLVIAAHGPSASTGHILRASDQLAGIDFESDSQSGDRVETGVSLAGFQRPDVCPGDSGPVGHRFLRQAQFLAVRPHAVAEQPLAGSWSLSGAGHSLITGPLIDPGRRNWGNIFRDTVGGQGMTENGDGRQRARVAKRGAMPLVPAALSRVATLARRVRCSGSEVAPSSAPCFTSPRLVITAQRRSGRMRLAFLGVLALLSLPACGNGAVSGSGDSSICGLAEQANAAVLSGEGPFAGKERELASAFRKAGIPKGNAEDVALLERLRSETATSIDAVATIPKGDAVALDRAQGAVEGNLADIMGNGLCAETAQPGPTRPPTTLQSCPTQPIKMGPVSAWTKVGTDGTLSNWTATATFTNPNNSPFVVNESTAVITYTGGRVPTALISSFNGYVPTAQSKLGVLDPLVPPGGNITVTLDAVSGPQVTAIATSQVFATGRFSLIDCPGTIEGAKPYKDAPQKKRAADDTSPERLPPCGRAYLTQLCR